MKKNYFLTLALALIGLSAQAQTSGTCGAQGDNLTWSYSDNTLTISGTGDMADYEWQQDVPWYSNRELITDIIIDDGVTSIGECAFWGCNITSIDIPNSVTSIGMGAFNHCQQLTSVTIPDGITSIKRNTFYNCIQLNSVTIPNSVTSIGISAFYKCQFTSVDIPSSVTFIGLGAFGYTPLISVTIPSSVDTIDTRAFQYCEQLSSVTLSNGVAYIGQNAFVSCSQLTSIVIPSSVAYIGGQAFHNCSGLTSITFNSLTPPALGNEYVFYGTSAALVVNVPCGRLSAYQNAENWSDERQMTANYWIEGNVADKMQASDNCDEIMSALLAQVSDLQTDTTAYKSQISAQSHQIDELLTENSDLLIDLQSLQQQLDDCQSTAGIASAPASDKARPVGYYNTLGERLPKAPASGVYIILYDNGKTEKIVK